MSRRKLAQFGFLATALGGMLAMACGGKSRDERSVPSAGGEPSGGAAGASAGAGGARGGSAGTISVGASAGSAGMGGTAGDGGGTAGDGGRLIPQTLCNTFFGPTCIEGESCTCRDDPRPECQATMTCAGGWQLTLGTCGEPPEETLCPESPEAARNMPCLPQGKVCDYPGELSCVCLYPYDVDGWLCRVSNGPEGPVPLLWYCGEDREDCPVGIPAVGTACAHEGLRCGDPCGYGFHARSCREGLWEVARLARECL